MKRENAELSVGMGTLPSFAPLANPYVPYQMENPIQYEARKGIVRGTLYPGLDLPFMGTVNKKPLPSAPLADLQVLAFAIQELALYLDTHRTDAEALELYKRYQKMYASQEKEYTAQHGPLNHMEVSPGTHYEWLSDPWPWEYCNNRED